MVLIKPTIRKGLLFDNVLKHGKGGVSENFSNFKFLQIIIVFIVGQDLLVIYVSRDLCDEFREYTHCLYRHFQLINIIISTRNLALISSPIQQFNTFFTPFVLATGSNGRFGGN